MSCIICKRDLNEEPTACVRQKGLKSLVKYSQLRKDNLDREFRDVDSIILHIACRRNYTRGYFNSKGEYILASLVPKITTYTSLNEDYDKYTNYLINEGNKHHFNFEHKNSDLSATGVLNTNKLLSKEEHIDTPLTVSVSFEPGSSQTSVESYIKYTPITIQDSALPQLARTSLKPDETSNDVSQAESIQAFKEEIDPSKPFPFEDLCFICAKDISSQYIQKETKKHMGKRNMVIRVAREQTKDTVIRVLTKKNTPENQTIIKRIKDVDLVQANAGYHKKCMIHVHLSKIRNTEAGCRDKITAAMEKIYKYIDETNKTNYTIKELLDLNEDSPVARTIKSKLETKYPGQIYFTFVPPYSTVVTIMKNTIKEGIQDDGLIWKQLNKEKKRKLKDKKEKKNIKEEIVIEEKRKSSRITVTEKKRKESMGIIDQEEEEEERITKKKKESKQKLKIKNERNISENDGDVFSDYPPSPAGDNNVTCEEIESSNEEDYKNTLVCSICLSSDRQLNKLGEYCDMYWKICADVVPVPDDTKLFLVCWECRAALAHAMRLRARAEVAHRLLSEARPESLSTISITSTDITTVSCECGDQGIKIEMENVEQTEETNQNDNFHLSRDKNSVDRCMETVNKELITQYSPRPVTEVEENKDEFNTFDDGWSDEEMDNATVAKRPRRSAANVAKGAKESDDDEEVKSDKSDVSSSDSSDSAWEEEEQSAPTKRKHEKPKPPPLRFRIKIQDYDVDSKIRREPITEQELDHWLECERNSAYFKLTKRKKCNKCISEIPQDEDHEKIYHSKSNPLVCHICKFTCSSEAELLPHIARHYFVFRCSLCSYQCYNEFHIRNHVHWHKKSVCCLDCQGEFKSMDEFRRHYDDIHVRATCDHCGKHFSHKQYLETHIKRHHVPQLCTICNKTYSALKQHVYVKHRVERTEAAYCVQCDIQFDNEILLKRHVYSSSKHASERKRVPPKPKPKVPERHACPKCPNEYRCAYSLRNHYALVHENKIRFYCDQCNKAFTTKCSFKLHMKRHAGYLYPKNKICQYCGQGFSTKRILTNHIRTHTGERPFVCPRAPCAAAFAQEAAMRAHVKRAHEKVGPVATSSETAYNFDNVPFLI